MAPLTGVFNLLTCAHRFSWPFRGDSGAYYQVCVDCGAEYSYDWERMRRVERTERHSKPARASGRARPHRTWKPRERRHKLAIPLRFRFDAPAWFDGTVENISKSGILFQCELVPEIEEGAAIQLVFEMPEAISGIACARVLCRGRVARSTASSDCVRVAIAMYGYDFLPDAKLTV